MYLCPVLLGITAILSILLLLLYFRIADRYNIIDKPNERSSHSQLTIRGGGVIFPVFFVLGIIEYGLNVSGFNQHLSLVIGVLIMSFVSFYDDVKPLKPIIRILFQTFAVSLMVVTQDTGVVIWVVGFILVTGTINAYNFMDGINGITALYSLIALGTLYAMGSLGYSISQPKEVLLHLMIAVLAFGFFNIRKKARCFSGDVGAVSLAFIICHNVFDISVHQGSPVYILFLGIYGLDAVATIVLRLKRREDIFKPHRTHFYQYLANEMGWSHTRVSLLYAIMQLCVNVLILYHMSLGIALYVIIVFVYIFLRIRLQGSKLWTVNNA